MNLNFIFILITIIINRSTCKPQRLSAKEKVAVDQLRSLVSSKLTIDYMKSDAYLIKWLKAKSFNVNQAQTALEKTLEWRKETGADNLPFIDFSNLEKQYVLDFTTRDKEGRVVMLLPLGDWDIRKKAIEGKVVTELARRLDYMEEKTAQLSYNLTSDPTSMTITDLAGFNLRKHACAGCIAFYVNWVRHHEIHYPYNLYKSYGINAIFHPIVQLMTPLMTTSTREAFRIFGYDRDEWSKYVLETINPEELPVRFGGTKKKKCCKCLLKIKLRCFIAAISI